MSFGETFNIGGIVASVSNPTVTNVTSASGNEGTSLVHTVTLSAATTTSTNYTYSLSGGTATAGVDYTVPPTFSNGVTLSGSLTVPTAVSSFTVTVAAISDGSSESSETYNLTIGGITGVGTISDAGASLITPSVAVSRTSGVAPLAILFDASATTAASYTSRPFHDLEYRYDFGDEDVSTWTYGAQPGVLLKNVAYGSTAAHVYESAGTFSPTVTIRYRLGDGSYDSTTYSLPSVTVTAADTYWATTKTVCYSTNTDFTGAPSGCVQVSNVTNLATSYAANKGSGDLRHLLHDGQTFSLGSSTLVIAEAGPGMFGKFGSGTDPIITHTAANTMVHLSSSSTPTTVNDWRFQDITFDGASFQAACFEGRGACTQMLIHRCDVSNISFAVVMSQAVLDGLNNPTYTHAMWDQFYFVDSTIYNLIGTSGPCGIFASWDRAAILGCDIDNNGGGEHGCRTQYTNRQVFSNNTVSGIAATKANFSIRGCVFGGDFTMPAGSYSEKNIISDNLFEGGVSGGVIGIGPQNGSYAERGRNMIVERNLFTGSTNTVNAMTCAQTDITYRNNVFLMQAGLVLKIERSASVPYPTNIGFYGNTVYSSQSSQFIVINQAVNPADWVDVDPGDVLVTSRNNLAYAPSASGISTMWDDIYSGGTLTSSNDTSDSQLRLTSPNFTTTPPTTIAQCKPTSGYAVAGGVGVAGLYRDILGVATPTTPVIGAVED